MSDVKNANFFFFKCDNQEEKSLFDNILNMNYDRNGKGKGS